MSGKPQFRKSHRTGLKMEKVVWDMARKEAGRLGITTSRYVALLMEAAMFSLQPRIVHPPRGFKELRDLAKMSGAPCTGTKLILQYARNVTTARSKTRGMDSKG